VILGREEREEHLPQRKESIKDVGLQIAGELIQPGGGSGEDVLRARREATKRNHTIERSKPKKNRWTRGT